MPLDANDENEIDEIIAQYYEHPGVKLFRRMTIETIVRMGASCPASLLLMTHARLRNFCEIITGVSS